MGEKNVASRERDLAFGFGHGGGGWLYIGNSSLLAFLFFWPGGKGRRGKKQWKKRLFEKQFLFRHLHHLDLSSVYYKQKNLYRYLVIQQFP